MIFATLFTNPIQLSPDTQLWLLAPLCVGVAVIYKTVRTTNLRRLPLQILALLGYMLLGLAALAIGLWVLHTYWPF